MKTSNLEKEIEKEQQSEKTTPPPISNDEAKITQDPFRPTDESLTIGDVEPYHKILLNKFMVIPEHLLIVTKEFEPQTDHLTLGDFQSIVSTFNQLHTEKDQDDYICFYNRGLYSGASQPHKHVQIVPKRERNDETMQWSNVETFPLPEQFNKDVEEKGEKLRECALFPFLHQIRSVTTCFDSSDSATITQNLYESYISILKDLDLLNDRQVSEEEERFLKVECLKGEIKEISLSTKRFPSYNLLFNKKWMLIVPRRNENFMGISCNSLAFLHGFFCKTDYHWEKLKTEIQIPRLLAHVTFPKQ